MPPRARRDAPFVRVAETILADARERVLRRHGPRLFEPVPGTPCSFRHATQDHVFERHIAQACIDADADDIHYLVERSVRSRFPRLNPDRALVGFVDGVLDIVSMTFVANEDIGADHPWRGRATRNHIAARWEAEGREAAAQAEGLAAFLKVVGDQMPTEAARRLLCAMLGRTLFDVGRLDRWGAAPFLWGPGGTGKSLLIHTLCRCLEPGASGLLLLDREDRFALGYLHTCEAVFSHEAPEDFELALHPDDLRALCRGGPAVVRRRTRPRVVNVDAWRPPLLLAGNHEPPEWAVRERLLLPFRFPNTPESDRDDPALARRIAGALPAVLRHVLEAYHDLIERIGPHGDLFREAEASGVVAGEAEAEVR